VTKHGVNIPFTWLKTLAGVVMMGLMTGCVSQTQQLVPVPVTETPSPGKARVILQRADMLRGKFNDVQIQANGKPIGVLGNGGTLIWDAEPGLLEIRAEFATGTRFLVDCLSADKIYRYKWSWAFANAEPFGIGKFAFLTSEVPVAPHIAPHREAAIRKLRSYKKGVTTIEQFEKDFMEFPASWSLERRLVFAEGPFQGKGFGLARMKIQTVNVGATRKYDYASSHFEVTYAVSIDHELIAELSFEGPCIMKKSPIILSSAEWTLSLISSPLPLPVSLDSASAFNARWRESGEWVSREHEHSIEGLTFYWDDVRLTSCVVHK